MSVPQNSGGPRRAMIASSSRATRAPEIEVSGAAARHSRVQSSITTRIRNRRPSFETVRGEVERPALVRQGSWRSRAGRPLAAASAAHRQALLAVQPVQLLSVHDHAFALEQNAEAARAKAA